jgi:hypothetical protein
MADRPQKIAFARAASRPTSPLKLFSGYLLEAAGTTTTSTVPTPSPSASPFTALLP